MESLIQQVAFVALEPGVSVFMAPECDILPKQHYTFEQIILLPAQTRLHGAGMALVTVWSRWLTADQASLYNEEMKERVEVINKPVFQA